METDSATEKAGNGGGSVTDRRDRPSAERDSHTAERDGHTAERGDGRDGERAGGTGNLAHAHGGGDIAMRGRKETTMDPQREDRAMTVRRETSKDPQREDRAMRGRKETAKDPQRDDRAMRGRRETAMDSYRDHSSRNGYERAWHAMSGYERSPSPTSMYDGAPHPSSGYERLSVERAHTMKDFEKQITELKKENFNLKLRIYFLEEQVQRRGDSSSDELHRMNIELKVEVESLKHDFQEKHNLLVRASKAMESLASQHDLTVQRLQDEHLKDLQDMADTHHHKVHLLETAIDHEKAELEKVCVLLDQERMQRFSAEERLIAVNEQYSKSMGVLEERDWIIQCLNETVHSKDALIAQLEKQIASMMPSEEDKMGKSDLYREGDGKDLSGLPHKDIVDGTEEVNEWQKKIREMDNVINELQQKLEANRAASAAEEKNSLKREKAIQGLTLALKKKTKENNKLFNEVENLNAALTKARENAQQAQTQSLKESSHPEYKKVIFTLQAEQDIYSRLLNYERESGNLHKELESTALLRKWLEENIRANQELRKIMEAQIMAKYRGDDSMSFLGDQTSYLSLDHLDHNDHFFARAPYENNVHISEAVMEDAATQTQDEDEANLKSHQEYRSGLLFNVKSPVKGDNSKNMQTSSATQTELETFSADVPRSPYKSEELAWTLQDEENIQSQRLPHKTNDIQGCKQEKVDRFIQNSKKSRLPVFLKSSLNTKIKTPLAPASDKEEDHECPQELQIDRQSREEVKSVEVEAKSFKENKDFVLEKGSPGREQKEPTQQEQGNHILSEGVDSARSESTTPKVSEELSVCQEEDFYNSRERESVEKAFRKLQEENYRLSEQLKQAQREIETRTAHEDPIKNKDGAPELPMKEHRETTDKNIQLCQQVKLTQTEIQTMNDNEGLITSTIESTDQTLLKELQFGNIHLSPQLKLAQTEIQTPKANEGITQEDTAADSSTSYKGLKESTDQTLLKELQAENIQLYEQLKRAQIEIQTLKGIIYKDAPGDSSSSDKVLIPSSDQTLLKEVKDENIQLSKQLKLAQTEIQTLKAKELHKEYSAAESLSSNKLLMESTGQTLLRGLQAKTEDLKPAQTEIQTLKAKGLIHEDSEPHSTISNKVLLKFTDETLQRELQAENHRLTEQLEQVQRENETLLRGTSGCNLCIHKDEPRKSVEQVLEKELEAENQRLYTQLKLTQMQIEIHENSAPGLSSSCKEEMEPTHRALQGQLLTETQHLSNQLRTTQKELEAAVIKLKVLEGSTEVQSAGQTLQEALQVENYRLTEQLKQAQTEIEKLQAEQRSTDSTDDSLKLHGSDADDDLSEQSFLDKTITNSVNVINTDATSDFGDEVCQPNVTSQNVVALRCHHDSHCTECANNREILTCSKRISTMHTSSKHAKMSRSGRSYEDSTSLSQYDLLVQSQARELSLQRQKIKESHNLSVVCSKNFYNVLKAFENLFPASALDSNITLGFREQINQTVEWLKELEYKLSDALYGEEDAYSDHSADSLLYTPSRLVPGHRMWADKRGCHVLGLVEDYNALRKQILEARNVLQEMEAFIDHGVQTAVLNMTEHFGSIFFEKLSRTKQSLEEAGCLLKLLWRVSLPLQIHSPYSINQEEEATLEITRLRKRVLEQEKLLSGMVKRVYSENQMKEDIEKLILDQLAMTHDILKRAKGNLEVQVVDKLL
ncbi:uncharacterized protein [Engystomops pustulosus]|uniref:uncharacterized protein n=1 Tax=Engystomops pustulosus TaxID=76066 RepID=UPI003AFAA79F